MIMSNQYRNDLGSPELIQVKESEPLGGESVADGVTPLRYTLANRQPTLTLTDTDMTEEGSDEDGSGPDTYNAIETVDSDVVSEPAEVRDDLAQIGTPIAQDHRRRRSGARKRVGRAKKTGKNGKKWSKEEKIWLYECYCWKIRLDSGFMEDVSRLYHTREYEHRSNASMYAQLKSVRDKGLTVMERECILERVKSERRDMGLAWEYLDGLWEDDRIFHAFDCECCMSDHIEGSDDNGEEKQGDRSKGMRYTLLGLGKAGDLIVDDEEDEHIEQENLMLVEGREDDDENENGELVEGEIDNVAAPAGAATVETDTWNEPDGTARALTEEERVVMGLIREVYGNGEWKEVPAMKAVNRKKLLKETELVDGLMHNIVEDGMGVTEVNRLLYTAGIVVASRLGLKIGGGGKKAERKKPHWQRRIETSIKGWRKDLSQVEEIRKGSNVGIKVRKVLDRKYNLTERGAASVSTFIKGKIEAGNKKIQWFVQRKVARRQNNLFQNNQRQLYKELGGASGNTNEVPDAADSKKFWEGIWSVETEHDKNAVWLDDIKKRMRNIEAMEDIVISAEDVLYVIRKMTNWKAPGPDGVRGFWFKKLLSLHGPLTHALQECVANGVVPEWLTKGRTVLIQKDKSKGKAVSNYRPIACLPLMWKLLTGIFALKIYDHLQTNNALPFEQKGCRKHSRGTKDQLLIDKEVLRDAKMKKRCLAMAWIDYRKAYDMLPHSWILESLSLIKVAKNIEGLLKGSMKSWGTILTANGEELGEVSIRRGIFQGDSLSPLLFIVAMIPLTLLLRREAMGYKLGQEGRKINHLLFMDDLKLYGRDEEEIKKLCAVVHKFSKDIGMEFGMDKCAVLEIKSGVQVSCNGIVLPDDKTMQEVEPEGYKYLGVLEGADIKMKDMKDKVRKEYLRRVKATAGSQLHAGNLLQAVNTWAVSVVRYTAGILDWSTRELEAIDTKTRKILAMNRALHIRSNVDRLYIKRKEGGRGLMSVEECVRAEEAALEEYVLSSEEWMLKVVAEGKEQGELQGDYKKRMDRDRKERLKGMPLHGKFFREVEEVADPRSWQWLKGGYLDKKNESYICAAQENALNTRYRVAMLTREGGVGRVKQGEGYCRKCGKFVETVGHLISGCTMLAQKEYRKRHDRMGLRVYWELLVKYGFERSEKWYQEVPDPVRITSDRRYEIRWDQTIPTARKLDHNKPDVVMIDHVEKKWILIDFSVPFDGNVAKKEDEKKTNYTELARSVAAEHNVRTEIIPIVVGALGVVTKDLEEYLKKLEIRDVIGGLQTAALIGTAAILKKVLST